MRESDVEADYRRCVEARGGDCMKFVSPGRNGVPDRISLLPIPEEHQAIVAKYIWFTELKAPGKKPNPQQVRAHRRLRELGFTVVVVDKKQ